MNLDLNIVLGVALQMGYSLPNPGNLTAPQQEYLAAAALISKRQREALEQRHGVELVHATRVAVHFSLASRN